MKKLMVSLLFCSATMAAMAQRAKVNSAEDYLKSNEPEKAQADINAALQNDKTKNDAKTWYVKGKVEEALSVKSKSIPLADSAYEAYKKALDINPKLPDAVLEMHQRMYNLYAIIGNAGYEALNNQHWDSAAGYFDRAQDLAAYYNSKNMAGTIATDTNMIFYSGYALQQAGQKDSALVRLQKAADLQFNKEAALYVVLGQDYEEKGDNEKWLKAIEDGKKLFPKDKRFNDMEMVYYAKTGKTSELTSMLDKKLAENPNDFATVLDYAIRMDNMANPHDEKGEDAPKPANYDELMTKAENGYKKAVELNGSDAVANFQLGALYFNRAVGFNKELNAMDSKGQGSPKGKDLQTKVEGLMNQALPFFEKAEEGFAAKGTSIEPSDKQTYQSCLYALQKIYAIKNQNDKVDAVKKKLEAL